jgi:hypothetical protein
MNFFKKLALAMSALTMLGSMAEDGKITVDEILAFIKFLCKAIGIDIPDIRINVASAPPEATYIYDNMKG